MLTKLFYKLKYAYSDENLLCQIFHQLEISWYSTCNLKLYASCRSLKKSHSWEIYKSAKNQNFRDLKYLQNTLQGWTQLFLHFPAVFLVDQSFYALKISNRHKKSAILKKHSDKSKNFGEIQQITSDSGSSGWKRFLDLDCFH